MNERPPQPPEGKLIADAATACGLSIREAAKHAGISYGRWRQITSGVQNVSPGSYAAVRAPAATLAKMARVVGLTPEQVESEGQRPDAAEIMRAEPVPPVRAVPALRDGDGDPTEALLARIAADYPRDKILQMLATRPGAKAETRLEEVLQWLQVNSATPERNGTVG